MKYAFKPVAQCDMCGGSRFKLLGLRLSTSQGLRPRRAEGIGVPVKKCDCGLVFADPLPIPDNLADHYGLPPEDYWNALPPWTEDYFAREIATAKALLPYAPGMKALDIGVGLGLAMTSLERAGFETCGIEPSEPFRARALSLGMRNIQLASAEDAEFAPASFDFITFGAVLEHLYSPSAALERAISWLKPGGIIQAEVPSSSWLIARLANLYFRLSGTNYVTHLSPMHVPFHLFEFGLESFHRNGRRLGYFVAEHQYAVCSTHPFPGFVGSLLGRLMAATDTGMQLTVYLRKSPN